MTPSRGDLDLAALLQTMTPEEQDAVLADLPEHVVEAIYAALPADDESIPASPIDQAIEIDPGYVSRAHLQYLSDRLAAAVQDVENGISRRVVISMPPRSGKSQMGSIYTPLWLLRVNPKWKIGLISHDPTLATAWGRNVRRMIESNADLGLQIAGDAGAASEWQTTQGGGVTSRSAPGQSITGRGFNIMIVDDVVKDFAAAHSENNRKAVWEWWQANAETRLEPPSLVIVIGTRWHEDDFIGRLLSTEYDGDPEEWEVISFPAIAEQADVLGRAPGQPLLSPLIRDEEPTDALVRWEGVRKSVGTYTWSALYQQAPAPATGAIFAIGRLRYWTRFESKATDDGKVVYFDPDAAPAATWLDSWDMAFKGTETSDYVVGQRWVRVRANRFLIAQTRDRRSFTGTLAEFTAFGEREHGQHVHKRLVEDKANGPAIIDTLRDKIAGIKPVEPNGSKEARARAVTPEIESGNVYLPHPTEAPWVLDLISELRSFPTGAHDDQVDALTQALAELRDPGVAMISNPGSRGAQVPTGNRRAAAARTGIRRSRGG
ncbi:terminase [Microbacterium phage Cressida]|uniref:Terminase n=1 Tax=Microbacterium phage Cressida TaxID=2591216 RepID=A0A514DI20_9CAUD|nr:terminase [Microbacterium phage Cressida]QDH93247.1 terminase [Microbacterium phage Cressida]